MIIHSPIFSGSITQAVSAYTNLSGSFSGSFKGVGDFTGLTADAVAYANVTGKPTLVSGSSQVSYPDLSNIPAGIVSGSSQVTPLLPTGVISGSSQILGGSGVFSGSSQVDADSITNFDSNVKAKLDADGVLSGSLQAQLPTGVISGSSQVSYPSVSNIPAGIVSGSTQVTPLLPTGVVSGSSQVIYVDISSIPAGIISGSSQLSGTSITDLTIINLTTVNETASVIFSSGSNRFGDFGNDTHSFTGSVQVSGSFTLIGSSTATSYNGTINATNGVVSGSAQIDGSLLGSNKTITIGSTSTTLGGTSTTIAGLTSVTSTTFVGALTGNASTATTSAALTTARTINGTSFDGSANITIPNLVSGSSQVTLSSTTGGGTSAAVQFGSLGIGMAASVTTGRIDATNDIVAYSSSDIRFKENITPIENALDKISKIGGYTYDWKQENHIEHGYEGNDVGVIAQEIEAILPQLVQTRESGYKAVKYDKLVALLIEGIKEQQKQIDELKSRLS
jgi:hypothetical protein